MIGRNRGALAYHSVDRRPQDLTALGQSTLVTIVRESEVKAVAAVYNSGDHDLPDVSDGPGEYKSISLHNMQ
jgi:hypothetical protein